MNWEIKIPHRDRGEPLVAIVDHARVLPPDEQRVVRQLALDLTVDHDCKMVGDALHVVGQADPAARRALLNRARKRAGLPSTEEADELARVKVANLAARRYSAATSGFQICHSPECDQVPVDELTGLPGRTPVRRWFCADHVDEAAPGDMEPRGFGLRIAPGGAVVPVDPGETGRVAAEAESRRVQQEAKQADAKAEAEHVRRHREAQRDELRRLVPPGVYGGEAA